MGFTAPVSGRQKEARHIRAYMTKYVRIPANTYIFVLRKKPRYPLVTGNTYRYILIQYVYWLIYLRNRGLIEVLWRQRVHRDWATGRSSPGQPEYSPGRRTRIRAGDRERSPPIPYVLSRSTVSYGNLNLSHRPVLCHWPHLRRRVRPRRRRTGSDSESVSSLDCDHD